MAFLFIAVSLFTAAFLLNIYLERLNTISALISAGIVSVGGSLVIFLVSLVNLPNGC